MQLWLLLIVLSLATFRLTRLVVRDDFPPIQWTRNKIIDFRPDHVVKGRDGGGDYKEHWWLGELVSCHWCSSGWISLVLVGATWFIRDEGLPIPVIIWFAVWGAGAALANRLM